jgi:hypothetical protein
MRTMYPDLPHVLKATKKALETQKPTCHYEKKLIAQDQSAQTQSWAFGALLLVCNCIDTPVDPVEQSAFGHH